MNLRHSVIDSEHILYGLTRVKDSLSSKILASYSVTDTALENLFNK